jgi:predicted methyltransferase MtxX (methanogen marker protein 4)
MSFVGQCLLLGYLLQKVRHASLLNDNALEGENIVVFAIGMLHNGGMNCTSGIMLRKNFRASFICDTASKFIDKSLQSGVREFFLENIAAA